MTSLEYFSEKFQRSQAGNGHTGLEAIQQDAFNAFNRLGIPTTRNEEWKYTRVSGLFNKQYEFFTEPSPLSAEDIGYARLPGCEQANELVFVNGVYSPDLSVVRSEHLILMSLQEAATSEYRDKVNDHLGHSSRYQPDGINALNTAFAKSGIFILVRKGKVVEHPVYIYNVTDARPGNVFAQPRALIYIGEHAQAQFVETYMTIGKGESLTSQVMEMVVEKDAYVEYYKIQHDASHANQVSTTHIRQIGKSHVHTVVISLNGNIIRNNLNIVMEAAHAEAHLYGLYFMRGQGHVDNHTVVDNVMPNCLSNELYKGILADQSTGVFNGKIFVRQPAQKTNAYQSNKNILLSDTASVNTKPQLEIFADDVKCSHGCTVGQLNEEGLFYLQSRGISEKIARSLLLHAFAIDVLEHIKPAPVRNYVDSLIARRLEF